MHLPDDVTPLLDGSSTSELRRNILEGIRRDDYDSTLQIEEETRSAAVCALAELKAITFERVRLETTSDWTMLNLIELIEDGFPDKREQMPLQLRDFYQFREDLNTVDGVATYKDRIILPPSLRKEALDALHLAHHRVTRMTHRVTQQPLQHWLCSQSTHSNAFVPTTSITRGRTT